MKTDPRKSVPAEQKKATAASPRHRTREGIFLTDLNDEFRNVYKLAPQDRIDAIRQGVSAEEVLTLSSKMAIPKEWLLATLGLSRATLSRKDRSGKPLPKEVSERVLGVQALIGQVEEMVKESGNPENFDAAKWVSEWLNSPLPALGGRHPATYMDTVEGQKLISNLLAMAQTGAFA